jgi:hypothetical protein
MSAMPRWLFNVYRWAGWMLEGGARLRQHDRLFGRVTERLRTAEIF